MRLVKVRRNNTTLDSKYPRKAKYWKIIVATL